MTSAKDNILDSQRRSLSDHSDARTDANAARTRLSTEFSHPKLAQLTEKSGNALPAPGKIQQDKFQPSPHSYKDRLNSLFGDSPVAEAPERFNMRFGGPMGPTDRSRLQPKSGPPQPKTDGSAPQPEPPRKTEPPQHLEVPAYKWNFGKPGRVEAPVRQQEKPLTEKSGTQIQVRPGESIQRAIDKAPDGAVINVVDGVYREKINITRDNITLKAQGHAVLDMGGRSVDGGVINISNRSNVTVDGFEIRNVNGGDTPVGIRVDGSGKNIKVVNNDVHDIRSSKNAHGIAAFGNSSIPLQNVTIENNKVHDLKLGSSESVVVNGNVDGFSIVGNTVRDNDNIGIDVIGFEGVGPRGSDQARNGLIARNTVTRIDTKNNPAYGGVRCAAGIYVDGGAKVTIQDNTVTDSNYGIELASEHHGRYTEGIAIRGNRIHGNFVAGVSLGGGEQENGGVRNSVIENNDLSRNPTAVLYQHHVDRSSVTVRNNKQ